MYPWPSFGGFSFRKEEHAIYGTDAGWTNAPTYARNRPLGSDSDVITALSIGSAERTFEIILTPERFAALFNLLNTKGLFTDWERPIPDSRQAFLSELVPLANVISSDTRATAQRKRHCRVTFISA